MSLTSRGNRTALTYIKALTDVSSYYDENTNGVAFADFISDLINNFDSKKDEIIENLTKVKKILSKKNFTFGFIGDKEFLNNAKKDIDSFYNSLENDLKYIQLVLMLNKMINTLMYGMKIMIL